MSKKPTSKAKSVKPGSNGTAVHAHGVSKSMPALGDIENLIELLRRNGVQNFSWSSEGDRLDLSFVGSSAHAAPAAWMASGPAPAPAPVLHAAPAAAPKAPAPAPAAVSSNRKTVTSPFVGTFYRSPAPNADAYVREGQKVRKGDTLCIIEAMKLMNEIESEFDGKIAAILVENGQPVEFGEPLFEVEA
jgi:acetyl-CoA carboxylase biotin carboxyl carrier protein